MTETSPQPPARCVACGTELAPGMLACPACRRLVYADDLKRLAADADRATAAGELIAALEAWRAAVALLPPDSKQFDVISTRIAELSGQVDKAAGVAAEPERPGWARRAGVLGAAGLLLWKFKFVIGFILTKGKFLLLGLTKGGTVFSMLLSLSVYWNVFGWKWALGVIGSIYVHEMGHVWMLRRFGIPSTAPMFIPGFGAMIRTRHYPKDRIADARVGLAGPMWGLATALVCYGIYLWTDLPAWGALAHVGAWINLFNLIPVWQLDGAHGFRAMTRQQRWIAAGVIAATWLFTAEGLLVLLVLGAGWAAWQGDAADRPDWRALFEYAGLVALLAALTKIPVPIEALSR